MCVLMMNRLLTTVYVREIKAEPVVLHRNVLLLSSNHIRKLFYSFLKLYVMTLVFGDTMNSKSKEKTK